MMKEIDDYIYSVKCAAGYSVATSAIVRELIRIGLDVKRRSAKK